MLRQTVRSAGISLVVGVLLTSGYSGLWANSAGPSISSDQLGALVGADQQMTYMNDGEFVSCEDIQSVAGTSVEPDHCVNNDNADCFFCDDSFGNTGYLTHFASMMGGQEPPASCGNLWTGTCMNNRCNAADTNNPCTQLEDPDTEFGG